MDTDWYVSIFSSFPRRFPNLSDLFFTFFLFLFSLSSFPGARTVESVPREGLFTAVMSA